MLHFILTSVAVYFMTKFLPRSIATKCVFIFSMAYIVGAHIYRMYTDYLGWSLDYTGPLMLLVIKYIIYAVDVSDMSKSEKDLEEMAKKNVYLANYIRKNKLERDLTPLEYTSYMFWFNSILSGPVFTPSQHIKFINMSMFPNGEVPSGSYMASLKIFLYALLIAPTVVIKGFFSFDYCFTSQFMNLSIIYRSLYVWIATSLMRSTYYFAWLLTESSNIITGIGYRGVDPNTKKIVWDNASNVRVLKIETAKTFKEVTENWNLAADRWLRYYVYARLPPHLQKYSVYITYLTSAVWHGLYVGYYMAFGSAAFGTHITRIIYKKIRPHFIDKKTGNPSVLYNIVANLFNSYIISYCFIPFAVLSFEKTIGIYNILYWHGHIIIILVTIILHFVPTPKPTKKEE